MVLCERCKKELSIKENINLETSKKKIKKRKRIAKKPIDNFKDNLSKHFRIKHTKYNIQMPKF